MDTIYFRGFPILAPSVILFSRRVNVNFEFGVLFQKDASGAQDEENILLFSNDSNIGLLRSVEIALVIQCPVRVRHICLAINE